MVVGRLPLYNPDPIDFMDDLVEKEIEIPTDLSPALQYPERERMGLNGMDLLHRFLEKDPSKRISIDEILVGTGGGSDQ